MSEFVNFYLFPALTIGSIYALGAVGISMIFGILRFAHFAHGDLMTLGAYGIMAIPTMTATILLAPKVMAEARRYFSRPLVPTRHPLHDRIEEFRGDAP